MLKNISKNYTFVNMSQKLISSFFKAPQSGKRKLGDIDNSNEDDGESNKKVMNEESANLRAAIIALAKKKPALSPGVGLTWFKALEKEFSMDYFDELGGFLEKERKNFTIYPPEKDVYFWTNPVKIHDVRVVILGQDPYHGPKQAHGLAFSVRKEVHCPPSLVNMYKELAVDIPGFKIPSHGYLYGWASQGVLLLNTCLTVRSGCPNSHQNKGWEKLTDSVIIWINNNLSHTVFMLWGANAKQKSSFIKKDKHLVLTAAHPSPLSAHRGFFGCKHFSKANEYLEKHNKKPIDWTYLP